MNKLLVFTVLSICVCVLISGFGGCALLAPLPKGQTLDARLEAFPTEGIPLGGNAEIFWDGHQIPFIHAEHDADVPLLLGMVHAHLRMGQMDLFRRLSRGRLAEALGPFFTGVDHSIRILNPSRAVPGIAAALPEETRRWLERYVEGLNFYAARAPVLPLELRLSGRKFEPWTLEDILTLSRVVSADVNWLYWYTALTVRGEPAWQEVWERLKRIGSASLPSFGAEEGMALDLLGGAVKSGSNSLVVSGKRSLNGGALIASDPHVGLQLPPLWVIVGMKSPSFHAVGFSIPGFPVILLGRNRHIAWGATNMLSLSSSLYDISTLPEDRLSEREETIAVRWWFDRKVTVRESPLGPVVTDSPFLNGKDLPPLALKWRGHAPSDEITALLKVNRASSWEEFRQAFETYAVSGQNFLYADTGGSIGQLLAVSLAPAATKTGLELIGDPGNPDHRWQNTLNAITLPSVLNPAQQYLVSTNNTPVKTDPPLSTFGNWNDRYRTISGLLESMNPVSVKDLQAIQQDTFSRNSHQLARAVSGAADKGNEGTRRLVSALSAWDGRYRTDSEGAAALELAAYHLASSFYRERYGEKITRFLLRSPSVYTFLTEDLQHPDMKRHLEASLSGASEDFQRLDTWGELHCLKLSHPLGNIPLLGRRFRFGEFPAPGSTQTVMKRAHPLSNKRHCATYGANARHISDLSDLDENYFVLLGGQDGFLGSETFLDQAGLWQRGQYVKVPLRLESVRRSFSTRQTLKRRIP